MMLSPRAQLEAMDARFAIACGKLSATSVRGGSVQRTRRAMLGSPTCEATHSGPHERAAPHHWRPRTVNA
jgi:hypothetical protein